MKQESQKAISANLRASFAPVWLLCRAAPRECAGEPDAGNDATAEGSAGHKAMEAILNGEEPCPAALAAGFGLPLEVCETLVDAAKRASASVPHRDWKQVLECRFNLEVGDGLPSITGHMDRIAWSPCHRFAHIDDWKFGRGDYPDPSDNYQMWIYALMVSTGWFYAYNGEKAPIEAVTVQIHYPRQRRQSPVALFDAATLESMLGPVREAARECLGESPPYRTGAHCGICPARHRCPAQAKAISRALVPANGSGTPAPASVMEMSEAQAGEAVAVARRMKEFADEVMRQAKARVDALGPIPLPDGSRLEKVERPTTKVALDAPGALDALIDSCGAERVLKGLSISKGAAESAARDAFLEREGKSRFGKGERQAVMGALFGRLNEAGAIAVKTGTRYEIRKGKLPCTKNE